MDDPDGPVPIVGSSTYKKWIAKALKKGYIKNVELAKEIPSFEKGLDIWNNPHKAALSDMYRKQCARCHIWEEGRRERGDFRAGGCSACHVLYTNDGYYEGNDPTIRQDEPGHMMKHEITIKIPATQCTHCHTRGKRIGTTFVGAFEYDYKTDNLAVPFNEKGEHQELLFTKDYIKVREDAHFEKGMECVDCHTSIDVHGDGNIYPSTLYQVEIQCADCHGTPEKYPWELPVGYGTPVTLEGERGIYKDELGIEYLLTSRGNARANLKKQGKEVILTSFFSGKDHEVPLLKEKKLMGNWKTKQGEVSMATINQHLDKLECYACHSTWAPQCFGCHIKYDRRKIGTDWITTALRHDPYSGKQTITKTPGDIYENRGFMRWEEPILGINIKGKVTPVIPGCQVVFTYVDENGKVDVVNKIFKTSDGFSAITMAPVTPHAVTIPARTCEDCHTNPKAIGYGTAVSRSQAKLDKEEEPMFMNNAEGYYGDIPGSKRAKWQVPKILEFPYAWDQLLTRSGKQVQNMPHQEDRPLNKKERDLMEREGLCIACHQYYGEKEWENIIKTYGKADTPEKHDEIMEKAMKALFEKAKGGTKR
ncbi:MAG TPA: cytochrome C [bacterium]|nr:cytochrome C [bacterium]